MTAAELREAAALMRERAEATKQPHHPYADRKMDLVTTDAEWRLECMDYLGGTMGPHCASWSPAVALAVSEWLDTAGADLWAHAPLCPCADGCLDCDDEMWQPHVRRALAVARAYLGTAVPA